MTRVAIKVMRVDGHDPNITLPSYATDGAAGADIRANLKAEDREVGLRILPGQRVLVPTGLIFEIPSGFEVQLRPRSGLALKHGITLANSPGTIDSDYRGAIGVIVINHGTEPYVVAHGERVAQIIVSPVTQAAFETADDLSATKRGSGGYGSTGTS